ncbi:MAG: hypothetical protein WBX38_08745 [Candidatus Sulfotelmatobacter sp.]
MSSIWSAAGYIVLVSGAAIVALLAKMVLSEVTTFKRRSVQLPLPNNVAQKQADDKLQPIA